MQNISAVVRDQALQEDLAGYGDCRTKMPKNLSESNSFMGILGLAHHCDISVV
jgi:hypothetical protein